MKKMSAFLLALLSFSAMAKPSCLIVGDCIEYEGRIIDVRSVGAKMYQDSQGCDALTENCFIKKQQYEMPMLNEDEFKSLVGKDGTQYFVPIDIREQDLLLLAGALSLGVVVFENDRKIMDFVQDHKVEQLDPMVSFGNFVGSAQGSMAIMAGSYFIGAVMKDGKLKQVGLLAMGSGLATALVTEVFKDSFNRVRPNGSESPYDFFEPGNKSFFSGHTSSAFSMATVVAEVYKDKPVVPYLAYGVAAITAYSRMHDQKHWASDVLAGAVAGTLVTKLYLRAFEKDDSHVPSGLLIIPEIGRDHLGNARYSVEVEWRPGVKKGPSKCTQSGLEGEALVHACFEEALNQ